MKTVSDADGTPNPKKFGRPSVDQMLMFP